MNPASCGSAVVMRLRDLTGIVLLLLLLGACAQQGTDESVIEAQLHDMADALEAGEARRFAAYLADDFNAVNLNLDRNGARLLLRRETMARSRIRARLSGVAVDLRGEDRAVADVRVLLTGGTGLIPAEGQWLDLTTGWRREGGEWKMISAQWEPVLGT